MEKLLEFKPYLLFVILVFPGLISMHIYRLLLPARLVDWKNALLEAAFYSAVNFGLCFPLLAFLIFSDIVVTHPIWSGCVFFLIIFVVPITWPALYAKLARSKLMAKLQLPFPTAWDAFFDRRDPCFVLVTLRDGRKVGGFFGEGSYATSFPNDGDMYISAVYGVDADGKFIGPIMDTKGCLIRKDDYKLIEFFEIPDQKKDI